MTRKYDDRGMRRIPGDGKYPGMTALRISLEREIAATGLGAEVEALLLKLAEVPGVEGGRHG